MAGSFVENINLLAGKLDIIEESNEIFDEGVVPILREISELDLDAAIADLKKGNYLGNRKLDINLIFNMLEGARSCSIICCSFPLCSAPRGFIFCPRR